LQAAIDFVNEGKLEQYEDNVKTFEVQYKDYPTKLSKIMQKRSQSRKLKSNLTRLKKELNRIGGKDSFINTYTKCGKLVSMNEFVNIINKRNKTWKDKLLVDEKQKEEYKAEYGNFYQVKFQQAFVDAEGKPRSENGIRDLLLDQHMDLPNDAQFPDWSPW
jgi:hypothetical protein